MKKAKISSQIVVLFFIFIACESVPKDQEKNEEITFINENFFSMVDSSTIYKNQSFFASFYDSVYTTRDSLTASAWYELMPLNEQLSYLPKMLHEEKLDQFLTVFEDAAIKKISIKFNFVQLNNTGLLKILPREKHIKHNKIVGTIGDLKFYRVLFDKKKEKAITMVNFWTTPKSSILVLFVFEKQNNKWVKIKADTLEQS
ncbi:MAG: hypothetical protein EAZ13_09875 [Sphingobacteriia bacterium]|nr:MAG: hypothetical protein EAZ35_09225 [Sphingobacteriia bacterium]TAH06341.1 MAG: hypothetical protein EAZ13_09875 [Sphingobacteriia bacterium]